MKDSTTFKDKTLMITGGTGSFGNTVLKHFMNTDLAEIRIFSRDEKKLDDMRHRLQEKSPELASKVRFFIGDVRNAQSVRDAMHGVDYIFHAAALKQVPSCEFFPMEAVRTNVIGTDNVLHAAIEEGVDRVVCLSTDKAAYPINAMGKSKAMMESIIYANARNGAGRTTICCTRYGNVMCSRGSVIPLFIDRIRKGEPLTVTDPNMTRFLMNLDEAVDLVQFAFEHANPGDLFIQKAPASTIGDLAEAVQEVFGRVGTQVIGTRHGEKLFETLMTREERLRAEDMGGYYRVACDSRDLNYDKFVVDGEVETQADESYTSHNTERLDVEGTIAKIKTAEYVQLALEGASTRRCSRVRVLVTGARGFVGRNLCCALKNVRDGKDRREKYAGLLPLEVMEYDVDSTPGELEEYCSRADFVFNLAGVNRPKDQAEFMEGNFGFASTLLDTLERHGNTCPVMLSSSAQASLSGRFEGSVYGESKLAGEGLFRGYSERTGAPVLIYRFPNLYGKWCRPRYNSAVATFCDAIANGRPYTVNDPSVELELLYIDDLVDEMLGALLGEEHRCGYEGLERVEGDGFCYVPKTDVKTLGEIVCLLDGFRDSRETLSVPDLSEGSFSKKLWSTFLSYYEPGNFSYGLKPNTDDRGSFTEFLRTPERGQVSINVSRPGITKGNHWHMSKWERFLVVSGTASIKLRKVGEDSEGNPFPVDEYVVSGPDMRVVEMVPGYTHSITNLSDTEDLVTVMWANEPFDPESPDTYYEEV